MLWLKEVRDFVKSSKLILNVLNSHGKLSEKEIVLHSSIPERTVRYNLRQLVKKGIVKERLVWRDLRHKEFEAGNALCLQGE